MEKAAGPVPRKGRGCIPVAVRRKDTGGGLVPPQLQVAAAGLKADVIFTSAELAEKLEKSAGKVVVINSFVDREEIKAKVEEVVAELK